MRKSKELAANIVEMKVGDNPRRYGVIDLATSIEIGAHTTTPLIWQEACSGRGHPCLTEEV